MYFICILCLGCCSWWGGANQQTIKVGALSGDIACDWKQLWTSGSSFLFIWKNSFIFPSKIAIFGYYFFLLAKKRFLIEIEIWGCHHYLWKFSAILMVFSADTHPPPPLFWKTPKPPKNLRMYPKNWGTLKTKKSYWRKYPEATIFFNEKQTFFFNVLRF